VSGPNWQQVLDDIDQGLKTISGAVQVGAALGVVPEGVLVAPLVLALSALVDQLDKLGKGTLTLPAATVGSIDAATDAELVAKFDPATGLPR
jgi:hypothetical protein